MTTRCEARSPDGDQCGNYAGHDGNHTKLIASEFLRPSPAVHPGAEGPRTETRTISRFATGEFGLDIDPNGAWVFYEDHAAEVSRLTAERDAAAGTLAERTREADALRGLLDETHVDERGEVWRRPTAFAYAKVCAALHARESELSALRGALTEIKASVCGERNPRWSSDWATTNTRLRIADICDRALGSSPTGTET